MADIIVIYLNNFKKEWNFFFVKMLLHPMLHTSRWTTLLWNHKFWYQPEILEWNFFNEFHHLDFEWCSLIVIFTSGNQITWNLPLSLRALTSAPLSINNFAKSARPSNKNRQINKKHISNFQVAEKLSWYAAQCRGVYATVNKKRRCRCQRPEQGKNTSAA